MGVRVVTSTGGGGPNNPLPDGTYACSLKFRAGDWQGTPKLNLIIEKAEDTSCYNFLSLGKQDAKVEISPNGKICLTDVAVSNRSKGFDRLETIAEAFDVSVEALLADLSVADGVVCTIKQKRNKESTKADATEPHVLDANPPKAAAATSGPGSGRTKAKGNGEAMDTGLGFTTVQQNALVALGAYLVEHEVLDVSNKSMAMMALTPYAPAKQSVDQLQIALAALTAEVLETEQGFTYRQEQQEVTRL